MLTRPACSLQSERQLGQRSLENSSQAYDKQLLSKIGGPNTPTRGPAAGFLSTSAQETAAASSPHTTLSKLNGQLKPLSMPERQPLRRVLWAPARRCRGVDRWAHRGGSPRHEELAS